MYESSRQTKAIMNSGNREQANAVLSVSALGVSVRDPRGQMAKVVADVDMRVEAGELLAIVGESGAGKSLLCRAVTGMLPRGARVNGSIKVDAQETVGMGEPQWRQLRGRVVSIVFQESSGSLNPTMRVGDQIIEAMRVHRAISHRDAYKKAEKLLDTLLLPDARLLMRAYPHELSGGMQQRVSIAIAVAGEPRLLIADEPTRSLDMVAQARIVELLRMLQQEMKLAIVLVSHDLALVASVASKIAVMLDGRIVEAFPATELGNVRMPYTKSLLEAAALNDQKPSSMATFESVDGRGCHLSLSTGCSYARHCRDAEALCHELMPPERAVSTSHVYTCWRPQ